MKSYNPRGFVQSLITKFNDVIGDDFNIPKVLAVAQDLLKSELSPYTKLKTVLDKAELIKQLENFGKSSAKPKEEPKKEEKIEEKIEEMSGK